MRLNSHLHSDNFSCLQYPELVRVQGEGPWGSRERHKTCLLLVAQHIATYLGPLLSKPYVVEDCLLPAIAKTAGIQLDVTHTQADASHSQAPTSSHNSTTSQPSHIPSLDNRVHSFFDFLMGSLEVSFSWLMSMSVMLFSMAALTPKQDCNTCMTHLQCIHGNRDYEICNSASTVKILLIVFRFPSQEHELQQCVENVILCLLTGHNQAAEDIAFRGQKHSLRLLYALLSHSRLRKFCLNQVLFDKVRWVFYLV